MGFLKNIFGKNTAAVPNVKREKEEPEIEREREVSGRCLELLAWEKFLADLYDARHYISRKEYMPEVQKFSDIMQLVKTMAENDMLEDFCNKNGFPAERARQAYSGYENIV